MRTLLEAVEAECIEHGIRFDLSVPERSRADVEDPTRARERYYGFGDWDARVTRQCLVPWEIPFVDKDGRVFACCNAAAANEHRLGQIGPRTLDEIWTGPEFHRFRREIVNGATTPSICRRCTIAPLGAHLFERWGATVVDTHAERSGLVTVRVRNRGTHGWTRDDQLRVGLARPRDAPSRLACDEWLSPNRASTFVEHAVPPEAIATFTFRVRRPRHTTTEEFAIVADGAGWLPSTHFTVTVSGVPIPERLRRYRLNGRARNAIRSGRRQGLPVSDAPESGGSGI